MSADIIATLGDPNNAELQELLLQQAKTAANATGALVLNAKNIVSMTNDLQAQEKIIEKAKDIKMTTSQLVECTKVLAPHINNPLCQEQMTEAAKLVAKSVDAVSGLCLVRLCNLFYFFFPFSDFRDVIIKCKTTLMFLSVIVKVNEPVLCFFGVVEH